MPNTKIAMVVEDDEEILFLIKFMLEREGYDVLAAADGKLASEVIQNNASPDFVLLDVMLPYKDGFQLIAEIRKKTGWEKTPVVMLTAKGQGADISRALEAGADDYIVKPFQPAELMARLKRLIQKVS